MIRAYYGAIGILSCIFLATYFGNAICFIFSISKFEGGCGYFIFFVFAPIISIVGCILGIRYGGKVRGRPRDLRIRSLNKSLLLVLGLIVGLSIYVFHEHAICASFRGGSACQTILGYALPVLGGLVGHIAAMYLARFDPVLQERMFYSLVAACICSVFISITYLLHPRYLCWFSSAFNIGSCKLGLSTDVLPIIAGVSAVVGGAAGYYWHKRRHEKLLNSDA